MLPAADTYDELCATFRWSIPARFNIGVDTCDKWADDPDRVALIHEGPNGVVRRYSFLELKRLSNSLANVLAAHGVSRGDRVAILLPQRPETAVAHIATYKLGAIAVPLFTLFGPDALEYRLRNSGAKALITDRLGADKGRGAAGPAPFAQRVDVGRPRRWTRSAPATHRNRAGF